MITDQEIDERNAARDLQVLDAACRIVRKSGLSGLTRETIAYDAGVSPASVSNFGRQRITNGSHTSEGYRTRILNAMAARGIEEKDVELIQICLADGCLKAENVPCELWPSFGK